MKKIDEMLSAEMVDEPTAPAPTGDCGECGGPLVWRWFPFGSGKWVKMACEQCTASKARRELAGQQAARLAAWRKQYATRAWPRHVARRVEIDERIASFTSADRAGWRDGQCGLYLTGDVGTGKTQALVEAGHRVIERMALEVNAPADCPVHYASIPRLLSELRGGGDAQVYHRAPWLLLDELGCEGLTDWGYEQVYTLIDARYGLELPTLLASNTSLVTMMRGAVKGWDARLMTRCSEMIGGPDPDGRHPGQITLEHGWRLEVRK